MFTRSQSKKYITALFEINIDFDEASKAWKMNKKSNGNGTYSYICLKSTKNGNPCTKKPLQGCDFCKIHKKLANN